ncbi:hypothetical protein [Brevundimonas nasdae]|uniref:Uncharacterized protein n=1 Tax=Brevundimonas nasdae TaxID=172043 RepID=A0ACD4VQM9_9CAUL|nr:hypothetical protein [Brevundimonas nasdae]WOB78480.1 hypothetical protein PZA08_14430 [Brevundimonas nasdae]
MPIFCARFYRGDDDDNPDNRISLSPNDEAAAVEDLKQVLVQHFEDEKPDGPTEAILFTVGVDGVVKDRRRFSLRPDGVVEVPLEGPDRGRTQRSSHF